MFCFNEFAFTVQVKHKINSTQILGFIFMSVFYDWPFPHVCRLLCKECSISLLVLGSVFSDYVVFYGDNLKLNVSKSKEIVFQNSRRRIAETLPQLGVQ